MKNPPLLSVKTLMRGTADTSITFLSRTIPRYEPAIKYSAKLTISYLPVGHEGFGFHAIKVSGIEPSLQPSIANITALAEQEDKIVLFENLRHKLKTSAASKNKEYP